jgi:hypothetical protein
MVRRCAPPKGGLACVCVSLSLTPASNRAAGCRQYKNIDTLDFSDLTPGDLAVMKKVQKCAPTHLHYRYHNLLIRRCPYDTLLPLKRAQFSVRPSPKKEALSSQCLSSRALWSRSVQVDLINPHPRPSGGAHTDVRGSITSLAKPLLTASMLEAGDDKELDSLPGMWRETYLGEKWPHVWKSPRCPLRLLVTFPFIRLLPLASVGAWWSHTPPLRLPHALLLALYACAVFFFGESLRPPVSPKAASVTYVLSHGYSLSPPPAQVWQCRSAASRGRTASGATFRPRTKQRGMGRRSARTVQGPGPGTRGVTGALMAPDSPSTGPLKERALRLSHLATVDHAA